ncbi:MAG TPA: hypothetical protein VHS96_14895, partial [Bacteroidia bacterium]|nr:hypothetical protein [Bacteroidia bacterium]
MASFIEQLSQTLIQIHGAHLGELCVVFPSRRACAFMEASIGRHIPHATWSPAMYSIEDFVPRLLQTNILDPISLTFELWPIYQQAFPNETFDQFYAWGQLIVNDFNEVDLHLVEGEKIFQNLAELKRIDATIEGWLNEDGKLSPHQIQYMRFWELLGTFYRSLQQQLTLQGMASPGQALRSLSASLQAGKPQLPWKRVVFAGFNALAPAEESLITSLLKWDLADCYWDLDAWYTENEQQEAGRFFRALRIRWEAAMPEMKGKWNWIGQHLVQNPKEMVLTSVPKRVGQAKAAGLLLEEMSQGVAPESLALVLPDENLLFPVLHSLPESLLDVNVTMGYPLRNTPL